VTRLALERFTNCDSKFDWMASVNLLLDLRHRQTPLEKLGRHLMAGYAARTLALAASLPDPNTHAAQL